MQAKRKRNTDDRPWIVTISFNLHPMRSVDSLKQGLADLHTVLSGGGGFSADPIVLHSASSASKAVDDLIARATARPRGRGGSPPRSSREAAEKLEELLSWADAEGGTKMNAALASSIIDGVASRLASEHYQHLQQFTSTAKGALYESRPAVAAAEPQTKQRQPRRRAGGDVSQKSSGEPRAPPTAAESRRALLASRGTIRGPRAEGVRHFMTGTPFFDIAAQLEIEVSGLRKRRSDSEARNSRARYSAECRKRTAERCMDRQGKQLMRALLMRWKKKVWVERHRSKVWSSFFNTSGPTRGKIVTEWRALAIERRVAKAEVFASRTRHHAEQLRAQMDDAKEELAEEDELMATLAKEKKQLEARLLVAQRKAEAQEVEATIEVAQSTARALLHAGTYILTSAEALLADVESTVDARKLAAVFWIEREADAAAEAELEEDRQISIRSKEVKKTVLAVLAEEAREDKVFEKEHQAELKRATKSARLNAAKERNFRLAEAAAAKAAEAGSSSEADTASSPHAEVPSLETFENEAIEDAMTLVKMQHVGSKKKREKRRREKAEGVLVEAMVQSATTELSILARAEERDACVSDADERIALREIHELSADDVVLRWVAHALRRTIFRGFRVRRTCCNLRDDLRDGCIYVMMMKHIIWQYAGTHCIPGEEKMTQQLAEAVELDVAKRTKAGELSRTTDPVKKRRMSLTLLKQQAVMHAPPSRIAARKRKARARPAMGSWDPTGGDAADTAKAVEAEKKKAEAVAAKKVEHASTFAHVASFDNYEVTKIDHEMNPKVRLDFVMDVASCLRPSAAAFCTAEHVMAAASSFPNAALMTRLMLTHHGLEMRGRSEVVAARARLTKAALGWQQVAARLVELAEFNTWGVDTGGTGSSTKEDRAKTERLRIRRLSLDALKGAKVKGAAWAEPKSNSKLWLASNSEAVFAQTLERTKRAARSLTRATNDVVALLPMAAKGRAHWRGVELKLNQFLWQVFDVRVRQCEEAPPGTEIDPLEDHAEWRCMDRRFEKKFKQFTTVNIDRLRELLDEARLRDVVEPAKRAALVEAKPRVLSDAEIAALVSGNHHALPVNQYELANTHEALESSLRKNFFLLSSVFEHYAAGADDGQQASTGGGSGSPRNGASSPTGGRSASPPRGGGDAGESEDVGSAMKIGAGEFFVFIRDCRMLSGAAAENTTKYGGVDGVAVALEKEECDAVFNRAMLGEIADAQAHHAASLASFESGAANSSSQSKQQLSAEVKKKKEEKGVGALDEADDEAAGEEGGGDSGEGEKDGDENKEEEEEEEEDEEIARHLAGDEEADEEDIVTEREVDPPAFVEALIHVALRKLLGPQVPHVERLDELIAGWIEPNALQANLDTFRAEVALDAVQRVLLENDASLKFFFKSHCQIEAVAAGMPMEEPSMVKKGWLKALAELKLVTRKSDVPNNLPEERAKNIFSACQMEEENEFSTATGGGDDAMIFME